MKILIVDDDRLTIDGLNHYLSSEGYEVESASDGFEALEIVKKQKLDLIICDIMMPNLSGLDVLSVLKNYLLKKTHFFLISSMNKDEIMKSFGYLGANEYFEKPINLNDLSAKIKLLKAIY